MRACPSCGTSLKEDMRFCPDCGTRIPLPTTEPTQALPTPQAQRQALPPNQAIPSHSLPVGNYSRPSQKRSFPWLVVALGIVGLCILMSAGLFILAQIGKTIAEQSSTPISIRRTPSFDSAATAEARQAERTATAEARATAQAGVEPTAEVVEEPTADTGPNDQATADIVERTALVATSEALTEQQAALQATVEAQQLFVSAKLIFSDEFVDNRNNWFTGSFSEEERDIIKDGVFQVHWSGKGTSFELYEVRPLTDFIVQVDCVVIKGDLNGSCGIVFAHNRGVGMYKYEVFNDYYRLSLVQTDKDVELLLEGDPKGIVKPNNTNRLKVIRHNGQVQLFLNDRLLDSDDDITFTSGKIGISTSSYDETNAVEVWFDNFFIWELP